MNSPTNTQCPQVAAAEHFTVEMLAQIRREFFKRKTDREFFQERNMLLQAISHPSDYLKQRGISKMPPSQYRQILQTVLETIRRHGQVRKIQRFSAYFLHAVQEHMKHHGDEYYYAAKEVRPVGTMLPATMRGLKAGDGAATFIDVLAGVNKTLRSKGGRKKADARARTSAELDLFGQQREGSVRSHNPSS